MWRDRGDNTTCPSQRNVRQRNKTIHYVRRDSGRQGAKTREKKNNKGKSKERRRGKSRGQRFQDIEGGIMKRLMEKKQNCMYIRITGQLREAKKREDFRLRFRIWRGESEIGIFEI